ncbi:hypothetical protein EXA23_14150 [Vibrio cincinnatiensis]|uniref:hypothetical protein n=1 Tax=Vibrio cincinnatiensis TaxID=675 RepID=UPI001EDD4BD8|nr:hypothetical protein [Vibrio cincinnatiensis]EGR4177502.1 hypothetical protein [Vibrio cholerae]MCG3767331.1 hypothetical protein [Vibrio cincinnatiensis]
MMDTLNDILNSTTRVTNVSGNWYQFQWTPDISTGETLNIGVGFKEQSGEFSLQMLDYYERINCFYGKEMQFQLELACNIARELVFKKELNDTQNLTPQITLKRIGFAQGRDVAEVLNNLYKNTIPLGKKVRKAATNRFSSTSRDHVYNSLKEKLKANLDVAYSLHVPENPYQTVSEGNVIHNLFLPYKKTNGVATLVSTAYSDVQRVKCNLFDGYRDIDIASNHLKTKENAVFLMLPDDSLKRDAQIEIENELDKFIWLLKPHNFHVGSHVKIDSLADEIAEWCNVQVA